MPKNKREEIIDDIDPETTPEELSEMKSGYEEVEDVAARNAVDSISAMIANSATIRIHRKNAGNQMAFLESCDPAVFSPDMVAKKYGGGTYVFIACDTRGKMSARTTYYVDAIHKPEAPPSVEITRQAQPESTKMIELILLMNKESKDQMMAQMNMLTTLLASSFSRGKENKEDNVIDMMIKLKQLNPDNTEKLLNMFKEGMQLANSKEEEKPFWQDLAVSLAPAILPALMGQQQPVPQITNISPPAPSQPSPAPGAGSTPTQNMLIVDVSKLVSRIVSAAKEKLGVEPISKEFIEKIESMAEKYKEVDADYVYDFIESDTWYTDLLNLTKAKQPHLAPLLEEHKEYLFKLRDAVIYYLDDPDIGTNDNDATGRDKDQDHAPDSANGAD